MLHSIAPAAILAGLLCLPTWAREPGGGDVALILLGQCHSACQRQSKDNADGLDELTAQYWSHYLHLSSFINPERWEARVAAWKQTVCEAVQDGLAVDFACREECVAIGRAHGVSVSPAHTAFHRPYDRRVEEMKGHELWNPSPGNAPRRGTPEFEFACERYHSPAPSIESPEVADLQSGISRADRGGPARTGFGRGHRSDFGTRHPRPEHTDHHGPGRPGIRATKECPSPGNGGDP